MSVKRERQEFACRQCRQWGDAVWFLRQRHGFDAPAARAFLELSENEQPRVVAGPPPPEIEPSPAFRAAVNAILPAARQALVKPAQGMLYPPARGPAKQAFDSLLRRGITPATMHARQLGFLEGGIERYHGDPASSPSSLLVVSSAIVIPWIADGAIWEMKLRHLYGTPRYTTAAWLRPSDRQAHPCGQPHLYGADSIRDGGTVILVEGELDAILLSQETGDLAAVCTLGSATGRITARAARHLLRARRRILALDSDEAGQAAARRLRDEWPGFQFEIAPPWPHKDPGESRATGVDLRRFTEQEIM